MFGLSKSVNCKSQSNMIITCYFDALVRNSNCNEDLSVLMGIDTSHLGMTLFKMYLFKYDIDLRLITFCDALISDPTVQNPCYMLRR